MKFLLILLLTGAGALACGSVDAGLVAGTWRVSEASRTKLLPATQRTATATIELKRDGTFIATEVPEDLLYGPPQAADRLVTGSGHWKLATRDGGQWVDLVFDSISAGMRGDVPYGTRLGVARGLSGTRLRYFQEGDADQGRQVEFEKQSE